MMAWATEMTLALVQPTLVAFFLGAAGFAVLLDLIYRPAKRPEKIYKFLAYFAFFATYGLFAVGAIPLESLQGLGRVELVAIALAEMVYHADAVELAFARLWNRMKRWKNRPFPRP